MMKNLISKKNPRDFFNASESSSLYKNCVFYDEKSTKQIIYVIK